MEYLLQEIPASPDVRNLIGVVAILVATAVASILLKSVIFSAVRRLTSHTSTTLDDKLLKATRKYLSLLVYVFGLSLLFDFVAGRYGDYIGTYFITIVNSIIYALGIVVVAILVVRVASTILTWYGDTVAVRTETTLDDEFIPLLDRAVKIVVITLSTLMVLDHFGIDIKGMVAVLGVGSLAVALAAQDTLANMIGGFTIMVDRPFRVGDMVRLSDDSRVIVHQIGIRSTKFLTFDNTLVIVPNSELVKSTVHNVTYPVERVRLVVDVGVGYGSDMEKVKEVLLVEARKHPNVLENPEPHLFFLDFGDSSLNVSLRCHVAKPENHLSTSSELRFGILRRFREEGIEIPFPQRVVTIVKEGGEFPSDGKPKG